MEFEIGDFVVFKKETIESSLLWGIQETKEAMEIIRNLVDDKTSRELLLMERDGKIRKEFKLNVRPATKLELKKYKIKTIFGNK